jgi:hypothetical protein
VALQGQVGPVGSPGPPGVYLIVFLQRIRSIFAEVVLSCALAKLECFYAHILMSHFYIQEQFVSMRNHFNVYFLASKHICVLFTALVRL